MKLSQRITNMQQSSIRKLTPYAAAAKAKGLKVYHLNIGQPDIKTPSAFYDAITEYCDKKEIIGYSASKGEPVLIDAILNYYRNFGLHYDKEHIYITNGGSEALAFTFTLICDAFDEIICPEPYYANYNTLADSASIKIVPVETKLEDGFHLPKKEEFIKKITDKTRAIMITNPSNPTGCVYTQEEVEMISEIAKEYNLFIISDEVYLEFAYDDIESFSFASVDGLDDNLIIIDSVSKKYSACGARVGYIATKNKELSKNLIKLCESRLCVPILEQIGSSALFNIDLAYVEQVKEEYHRRRDYIFDRFEKMDGVVYRKTEGSFYTVVKLPVEDTDHFCMWLLDEFQVNNETVMLAPGSGFYATEGLGKNEVRIAYVIGVKELEKALDILEKGLLEYNKK